MAEIPPPPPPPPPPPIIPSELIAAILSFLPVKIISRFRCVSKTWKKLISNPSFIKMHLQKSSSLNPNFILKPFLHKYPLNTIVSLPVSHLLHNNPSLTTLSGNTYPNFLHLDENCRVVGSCNGLLCLLFQSSNSTKHFHFSFRLWNPANRTITENLGFLRENIPNPGSFKFTFGCDSLTGSYKIVCLHSVQKNPGIWKSNVRVFTVGGGDGGDGWRNIESPFISGIWQGNVIVYSGGENGNCWSNILSPFINGDGVHLNGTVNWLAFSVDLSFVGGPGLGKRVTPRIASLDLSTETFTELLHPKCFGFTEVPWAESNLRVLLGCLCFCHDFRRTEFVIWQMKEFGVQDSWTRLFRIQYIDLQMPILPIQVQFLHESPLLPLYISKDGDIVILTNEDDDKAIIYNQRDNSVVRTTISNDIHWSSAIDYVESLVPTPWKSGDEDRGGGAGADGGDGGGGGGGDGDSDGEGEDGDEDEVGGGSFCFTRIYKVRH